MSQELSIFFYFQVAIVEFINLLFNLYCFCFVVLNGSSLFIDDNQNNRLFDEHKTVRYL